MLVRIYLCLIARVCVSRSYISPRLLPFILLWLVSHFISFYPVITRFYLGFSPPPLVSKSRFFFLLSLIKTLLIQPQDLFILHIKRFLRVRLESIVYLCPLFFNRKKKIFSKEEKFLLVYCNNDLCDCAVYETLYTRKRKICFTNGCEKSYSRKTATKGWRLRQR